MYKKYFLYYILETNACYHCVTFILNMFNLFDGLIKLEERYQKRNMVRVFTFLLMLNPLKALYKYNALS